MGCTEPAFWDTMAPLEKPISDQFVGGWGVTARVDALGMALTAATIVGVAAHAGLTGAKEHGQPKKSEPEQGSHE
jgi:Ni,Fe-hydrogenase I small subunit